MIYSHALHMQDETINMHYAGGRRSESNVCTAARESKEWTRERERREEVMEEAEKEGARTRADAEGQRSQQASIITIKQKANVLSSDTLLFTSAFSGESWLIQSFRMDPC